MIDKEELEAMGIENNKESVNVEHIGHMVVRINKVAQTIKIIAIVIGVLGFAIGLFTILNDGGEISTVSISFIIIGIVSAIFIYALGEIIQLLEDIKNK
jgi:hypothetical protein